MPYQFITFLFVFFLVTYNTHATTAKIIDDDLCLYGCPTGAPDSNFIVDHKIIILSSNRKTKFSDWVAYKVTPENINGGPVTRIWHKDPEIPPEYTLIPDDYKNENTICKYDRGHQAPIADFKGTTWQVTDYLSNITPQKADLNEGSWKQLENKVRYLSKRYPVIYVVTGPYYTGEKMCIVPNPRINFIIPNGYWKIISVKDGDNIKTVAFSFQQETPKHAAYCQHHSSISNIEKLSGLKFFMKNPSLKQNSLLKELGC